MEINCPFCFGEIYDDERDTIITGENSARMNQLFCKECNRDFKITFEVNNPEDVKQDDQDMEYDIGSKVAITTHYESMEELYAFIKTLYKAELSEDEKDEIDGMIIPVVTMISTDDEYPYAVDLNICPCDYKEVFRANILTIDDEGMLVNEFGDAGAYEFDPLSTIKRCVDVCLEIIEEWFE